MKKLFLPFLLMCASLIHAQDTLPKFSVRNVGSNRIVVGWVNKFQDIRQISIQRSFDSLKNYKSIMTVADPTTLENGYVDNKAESDHMFYRLYILLDKGVYLFSDPQRPVIDSARKKDLASMGLSAVDPTKISQMGNDSITVSSTPGAPKIKTNTFVPSKYVYTYKDGYVRVALPDNDDRKYSIKFFEDDGSPLFELKTIKEKTFRLDKSNFYHAGWFRFELYADGELIEKHKFYIEKDF